MRALNLLRNSLHYRKEAFNEGLTRAGFKVSKERFDPEPGDLLLIWNRYGGFHETALMFERAGAHVLVVENGYLGKDWRGQEWFSIARNHHAGAGEWSDRGSERWDSWGVELAPFRDGQETLILGQRGIGEPGVRSPEAWAELVRHRIGGRIRPHPGVSPAKSLAEDLANVGKVVTWHSGAALHALMLGVPVWHDYPQWIGATAGRPLAEWSCEPNTDEAARLSMFRRLAWSIWTLDEVRTGEPIATNTA